MASRCLAAVAPCVDIVPASLAALAAEEQGGGALAARLGVAPPQSWPPPFNDANTRAWMRRLITDHPDRPGFGNWYIVADGRLVGVCGCKGPPNGVGNVEIGYAVVAPEQGKGYAGAAVARLLAYIEADPAVATVSAETLPTMLASQRLLLRYGFSLAGERHHFAFGRLLQFSRLAH